VLADAPAKRCGLRVRHASILCPPPVYVAAGRAQPAA
jgi:hypothetical protein